MADILDDTVIIILAGRPPPVKTLKSYPTDRPVIILADPVHYKAHKKYYGGINGWQNIKVIKGKHGMIPQSALSYRVAYDGGYKYFFRLDDDLPPKTFVMKGKKYPKLEYVMKHARKAARKLSTSLTGFCNTSREDWLSEGYKKTYGLIHGGASLCRSSRKPWRYLHKDLPAYEDVYRTLAHRERDGRLVGRVAFIGFDKRSSVLKGTLVPKPRKVLYKAKELILNRFPDMVTCNGFRTLGSGHAIANWRMKP